MAEVNADTPDSLTGETALTVAASNGCHNVCTSLLVRGASISAVNKKVHDLLLWAQNLNAVKFFLSKKPRITISLLRNLCLNIMNHFL